MDTELLLICALTALINLIGALAYAARIAGVRTGRIALSFALFNILLLVSRTSNGFLGPFLAKRIETALANGGGDALIWELRLVLEEKPPQAHDGCQTKPRILPLSTRTRQRAGNI